MHENASRDPSADCEKADAVAWAICLLLGVFLGVIGFYAVVTG